MRLYQLTILALIVHCCVSGSEGASPSVEPAGLETLLRVYRVPPPSDGSVTGKSNFSVFSRFRELNPQIRFQDTAGIEIEGPAAEAGILMSIAGGTAPDVLFVNFRQSGSYIGEGFLTPLDEWIRPDITADEARARGDYDPNLMYKDELERRVMPGVMPVIYREGPDGKKHFWCLPFDNLAMTLMYNKVLFQKAGLDPEKDYPKTWDEYVTVARKLTDKDKGVFGCVAATGASSAWYAFTWFASMGVEAMKYDSATREWHATFHEEGAAEAADFFLQLVDGPWTNPRTGQTEYGVAYTESEWWSKWNQGQLGMKFDYLDSKMLAQINPEEIGIAPVPMSPKGIRGAELNCRMMGLFAGTKDPKVREAAWKYIRFFNGDEAQALRTKVYVENGFGNFIPPESLKRFGYEEYARFFPKGWGQAFESAFKYGVPEPYGRNSQAVYQRMSTPLEKGLSNKVARIADRAERLRILQGYLNDASAEANEKMVGKVPEEQMKSRRVLAFIVATLILATFVVMFAYTWRIFTPQHQPTETASQGLRKYWVAYLLLAPAVLAILTFNYLPLARGAFMAFMDYKVMGGSTFVGLDNFAAVLYDDKFWLSLWHALEFTLWYLALVFVPPIVLAILLSEIGVGKVLFRIIFYLPAVLSGIIMMILWKSFFDPSPAGVLNTVLGCMSGGTIAPHGWLKDANLAMLSIMITLGWAQLGPGSLIYLAALKTVPEDLYEAAAVDGAGFFHRIRHVTLPVIRPLIFIQLIFALIGAFQAADYILVMTAGGPDGATNVVGLEIFYNAYVYLRFGIASCMGWIMGFILIGATMLQMRQLSKLTFQVAGK